MERACFFDAKRYYRLTFTLMNLKLRYSLVKSQILFKYRIEVSFKSYIVNRYEK